MSRRRQRTSIILVAAVAFIAKLLLAFKTYGTNDVYTYERFGLWSRFFGAELYKIAPDLNHPPSMLHILSFILWISEHTHLPFQFCLRFPGILADVGSLYLICRILGDRLAERSVFIAVLIIAIAPTHILISGFHGNTDPVMIFFVMAAVWLAGYREKNLAGGAAYGVALCIKIAPVMLAPVFFLSLDTLKKRIAFFAGAAAVVALGWSPYAWQEPRAVLHQVLGYKSSYGLWGFSWLLRELANAWPASRSLNSGFSRIGTPLVMFAILLLSLAMHRLKRKPSLYTQIGMVFLFFFTATSGFAVQYLAWLTPWVAELGVLPVGLFTLAGSVFLLVVYNYWALGMPWYLAIAYPWNSHQYFQVLSWMSVLVLAFVAWRRIRGEHPPEPVTSRIPGSLRWSAALVSICALLLYPAYIHMKRDSVSLAPIYAEDEVLYTQADQFHNLATELFRHSRAIDANAVQRQADSMNARAQQITDSLVRLQPARYWLRTPESYVEASLYDYNTGDYSQCVYDATESLKLRPGMPAAWNNITLCNAEMGLWDAAVVAATEALKVEPENELVRQNLEWTLSGKRGNQHGK